LLAAAGELIAELGWGRVTTRAVAERAELPHGAVSYHFRGKQQLLTEAALHAFEQAIPIEHFEALASVDDLIAVIGTELGAVDSTLSRLMLEAMGEAERDDDLRRRMGALLGTYRQRMVEVVRADQQRGAAVGGVPAEAIATLLGAVGDGLVLHARLDPDLDVGAALGALRSMVASTDA
jgi:AcrR family transcriptional regulator